MDPQLTGWPLTPEEEKYILSPLEERLPGKECGRHVPEMWPVTPSAMNWGGTAWLDVHAGLVRTVQSNRGPVDILLAGDSITGAWGGLNGKPFNAAWHKRFSHYKTINIGIGGERTQNLLWRLDHGGVDGIEPRLIVLLIGNNNIYFTQQTGVEAAAKGIKLCVENLREKFPAAHIILVKILPAEGPGKRFYEDIKRTNLALDALGFDAAPRVDMLDLWDDLVLQDGQLKKALFASDSIHLSEDGYELFASKLQRIVERTLEDSANARALSGAGDLAPARASKEPTPAVSNPEAVRQPRLIYPYAPYNEGKMDPQLAGWPLTDAELKYIEARPAGQRWPGCEPGGAGPQGALDFVPVTPIAGGNKGYEDQLKSVNKYLLRASTVDILMVGDSITGAWEGYCEERPFLPAWKEHFGKYTTINLGVAGENTAGTLWRLDHTPFEHLDQPPRVCILQIGHNNMYWLYNGVSKEAATQGIVWCAKNLRARFPATPLILVNVFPTKGIAKPTQFDQGLIYARQRLSELNLPATDPMIYLLDLWDDMLNPDGTQNQDLFSDGVHLTAKGYALWAARLKPLVEQFLRSDRRHANRELKKPITNK